MGREVSQCVFSPGLEALPGVPEATALQLERIQALLTPSPQTEMLVMADLQRVAASAAHANLAAPAEIATVVEGFRWITIARPGEPVPAMLSAYTISVGFPVLERDWDLPPGLIDHFEAETAASRAAVVDERQAHRPEVTHQLRRVIELSEGYRLCSQFFEPTGERTGGDDFRRAELAQRIRGRYGVGVADVRANPQAHHEYTRGLALIEMTDAPAGSTQQSLGLSTAAARTHFRPLLEEAYARMRPGSVLPNSVTDVYNILDVLALDVACRINGSEACPVSNLFLQNVITSLFQPDAPGLAEIMQREQEAQAETIAECFENLPFSWFGGSWPRWWLNGLPYPGRPVVMPVVETSTETGRPPLERPEYERLERTTAGEMLIDRRGPNEARERRLILTAKRAGTLPYLRPDGEQQLRLYFAPKTAEQYIENIPHIPGYITVGEAADADGSRTFDFAKDARLQEPYTMCPQPFNAEQRQKITDFYAALGAERMVKNLEASRNLRVGDIQDLLARSSDAWIPEAGTNPTHFKVEGGYLHLQCQAAAEVERDSLIASGIAPAEAIRIIGGLVLPPKGEPLTELGHASVEYTDPAGTVFVLDPKIASRQRQLSQSDAQAVSVEAPAAPDYTARGVAKVPGALVEMPEPVSPPSETFETTQTIETTPAPEVFAETAGPFDVFAGPREQFERLVASALGVGTPNRPALPEQVWYAIQKHCSRPGDIVALTARMVDQSGSHNNQQDRTALEQQISAIEAAAQTIQEVIATPQFRSRFSGYGVGAEQSLLHVLSELQGGYERLLARAS